MKKRYSISSFQCCQSIENFYANVAKIIGITVTDNTVYDCRKIRVTVPVQNCIFAYYKENGFSNAAISCNWLMRGPKADLTGDDLAFEVEDGFTSESGYLCVYKYWKINPITKLYSCEYGFQTPNCFTSRRYLR